jgi:uncharacterized protein DUF4082
MAVRFYKGSNNTGTHIGDLWSNTGNKLAEVTFSAESASGWQQANFPAPVSIAANTTYVISYLAPKGSYAETNSYAWSTLNASPLHVTGSSPGVFTYGSGPQFPKGTWKSTNYSVDLVFVPSTVAPPPPPTTSTMFWPSSTMPAGEETTDTAAVTLGLKFSSSVSGSVAGVRFYKGLANIGTHVGDLWSSTGTKLAEAVFSGETASGWQQANFAAPVSIAANTTYVVSYLAPNGDYNIIQNYAWSTLSAPPLQVSGSSPGVYIYGSGISFPASSYNASNYFVDVVFSASGGSTPPPPATTYTISGNVSGSAATLTLSGLSSGSTATSGSGSFSFSGLASGAYVIAPSQTGYTFTPSSASVSVNGASITGVNFTATVVPIVPPPPPPPITHTVSLTWAPSTSPNIKGYNLYRSTVSGSSYTKLTASPVAATSYIDNAVAAGQIYYYVATTVDSSNNESTYSAQAPAPVPTP